MTGKELAEQFGHGGPSLESVLALIDEAIANDAYDAAVCVTPGLLARCVPLADDERCIGENHIETCPVLIAWQDRKSASEKRRGMR